jgi:hypothetical protein
LDFIIHGLVSHCLKFKLNPFTKSKSTTTSLLTCLGFITTLVGSQCQADAILYISIAFYPVPQILLLHDLSTVDHSCGYVNWFRSYLTNRQFQIHVSGILSSPLKLLFGVLQGSVLSPCFLLYLLMT